MVYYHWMEGMAQESKGVIEVLKRDGYDWDSYTELKTPKYIGDMNMPDWSKGRHMLILECSQPSN